MQSKQTRRVELANGITLVMDVFNPEATRTVVMTHGGGQTRGSWAQSALSFAQHGLRAITVDARGHGDSSWPEDGDYRATIVAADLSELLDHIGGRMILVGASMGGIMSLIVAAGDAGRRIDGLVLADVTPRIRRQGVDRIHAFMRANPHGFASVDEAAEAVSRYNPNRRKSADNEGLRRNLREREGRFYWHWDPRFLDSWDPDRQNYTPMLEESARRLRIPTLLIHASESDVVGEEEVDSFRRLIPHSEYYLLPGAGHMVAGDDGLTFSSRILRFLQTVYAKNL